MGKHTKETKNKIRATLRKRYQYPVRKCKSLNCSGTFTLTKKRKKRKFCVDCYKAKSAGKKHSLHPAEKDILTELKAIENLKPRKTVRRASKRCKYPKCFRNKTHKCGIYCRRHHSRLTLMEDERQCLGYEHCYRERLQGGDKCKVHRQRMICPVTKAEVPGETTALLAKVIDPDTVTCVEATVITYTTDKKDLQKLLLYLKHKKGGKCVDCGNTDLRVLVFNHRDQSMKIKRVTSFSEPQAMIKESNKCDMRCVNCHRMRVKEQRFGMYTTHTYSKLQNTQRRKVAARVNRSYIKNIKMRIGSCQFCKMKCTENNSCSFDFDHVNPNTKMCNISQAGNMNKQRLDEEIRKCRLLCANCHKLHTIKQRSYTLYDDYIFD